MSKKNKKRNNKKKTNKNTSKNIRFLDCVSVGDKITDVNIGKFNFGPGLGSSNGMLLSTGYKTRTGIHFDFNVVIPSSALKDEEVCLLILDKLKEGKYILCNNEITVAYVNEIKNSAASQGIKFGEIFFSNNNNDAETLIAKEIIHY